MCLYDATFAAETDTWAAVLHLAGKKHQPQRARRTREERQEKRDRNYDTRATGSNSPLAGYCSAGIPGVLSLFFVVEVEAEVQVIAGAGNLERKLGAGAVLVKERIHRLQQD